MTATDKTVTALRRLVDAVDTYRREFGGDTTLKYPEGRELRDAAIDAKTTLRDAEQDVVLRLGKYGTLEECLAVLAEEPRLTGMAISQGVRNANYAGATERFHGAMIEAALDRIVDLAGGAE